VLGLGVVLVVVGAAIVATPARCSGEELCGLGEALAGVTIMSFGGGVGLVGIVLTAIGGSSTSPTVPTGEPGIVYLPH